MSSFISAPANVAGALQSGKDQSSMLEYNATIQRQNAAEAYTASLNNAYKQDLIATKVSGTAKAAYGASGVTGDSGSVFSVMAGNAANAEFDKQNILYGGQIRAVNALNQASLDDYSAGRAISASYFNALAAPISGAANTMARYPGGSEGAGDGTRSDPTSMAADSQVMGEDAGDSTMMDATTADDAAMAAV